MSNEYGMEEGETCRRPDDDEVICLGTIIFEPCPVCHHSKLICSRCGYEVTGNE